MLSISYWGAFRAKLELNKSPYSIKKNWSFETLRRRRWYKKIKVFDPFCSVDLFSGCGIGNIITQPIAGWLCDTNFLGGWPSVFYLFGNIIFVIQLRKGKKKGYYSGGLTLGLKWEEKVTMFDVTMVNSVRALCASWHDEWWSWCSIGICFLGILFILF